MTVEGALAGFCTGLRLPDVPAAVRERVELLLVDAIACAFTARHAPPRGDWEAACRAAFGPGTSTVVGGAPMAAAGAVHLNAFQITATTMCDVYRPALCHLTPVIVPVVLAVAQETGATGTDVLTATAAGLEVTARLGRALDYPAFRAAGWHAPGVLGPFGAAAAAAVLYGFSAPDLRRAWGHALSQTGGTFAALGSLGVKFQQATGALAGYLAARFAGAGISAMDAPLTTVDGGLFAAYGGGSPSLAVDGLGSHWELLRISMRRWPAASSLQPVVECVLDLGLPSDAVESLELRLPPAGYALCADKGWDSQGTALQSARWVAAVVLSDGECWLDQFTDERRSDERVTAFAGGRVTVVRDDSLSDGAARVVARLAGGGAASAARDDSPGDPARPLTRDDVLDKLARATATVPRDDLSSTGAWFEQYLLYSPACLSGDGG